MCFMIIKPTYLIPLSKISDGYDIDGSVLAHCFVSLLTIYSLIEYLVDKQIEKSCSGN